MPINPRRQNVILPSSDDGSPSIPYYLADVVDRGAIAPRSTYQATRPENFRLVRADFSENSLFYEPIETFIERRRFEFRITPVEIEAASNDSTERAVQSFIRPIPDEMLHLELPSLTGISPIEYERRVRNVSSTPRQPALRGPRDRNYSGSPAPRERQIPPAYERFPLNLHVDRRQSGKTQGLLNEMYANLWKTDQVYVAPTIERAKVVKLRFEELLRSKNIPFSTTQQARNRIVVTKAEVHLGAAMSIEQKVLFTSLQSLSMEPHHGALLYIDDLNECLIQMCQGNHIVSATWNSEFDRGAQAVV